MLRGYISSPIGIEFMCIKKPTGMETDPSDHGKRSVGTAASNVWAETSTTLVGTELGPSTGIERGPHEPMIFKMVIIKDRVECLIALVSAENFALAAEMNIESELDTFIVELLAKYFKMTVKPHVDQFISISLIWKMEQRLLARCHTWRESWMSLWKALTGNATDHGEQQTMRNSVIVEPT
ncbi:hypothetical protein BC830DRAFT_1126526 [Chytriomyces sp. MP71]|nr:hypothetical protein BC830DRAFT_1126526 [Chytriomyces sp. MP71]